MNLDINKFFDEIEKNGHSSQSCSISLIDKAAKARDITPPTSPKEQVSYLSQKSYGVQHRVYGAHYPQVSLSATVTFDTIKHHIRRWKSAKNDKKTKNSQLNLCKQGDFSDDFKQILGLKNTQNIQGITCSRMQISILTALLEERTFALLSAINDRNSKALEDLQQVLQVQHGDRRLEYQLSVDTIRWKWSRGTEWSFGIVELFKQIFNICQLDAISTLAHLLSVSVENLFCVSNVIHTVMENPASYTKNILPSVLRWTENGEQKYFTQSCLMPEKGYSGQIIGGFVQYSINGLDIVLPVSAASGKLSIGRHKASALFLNQSAIDSNPHATVFFCQDIRTAFALQKIYAGSQNVIVTGHYGTDLSCFAWNLFVGRNVVLIVGASADCYANVEAYEKCLSSANVSTFKVYPHLLLSYGEKLLSESDIYKIDETEKALIDNARYLANENNAYLLQKHIIENSLKFDNFKNWGIEIGLFVGKDPSKSPAEGIKSPLFRIDDVLIGEKSLMLEDIYLINGVSYFHGRKNAGKSNNSFEIARAYTLGVPYMGCISARKLIKVLLLDTETLPSLLKQRVFQYGLEQVLGDELLLISKLDLSPENQWKNFDLSDDTYRSMLLELAVKSGVELIIIDNLTSGSKAGSIYSQTFIGKIFEWAEELQSKDIGLVLVHHSTREKNKSSAESHGRGSDELTIRTHSEIIVIGNEEILQDAKVAPEKIRRSATQYGATLGLYFKVCKMAHKLEQTTLWTHLADKANSWDIIAHTDINGEEIVDGLMPEKTSKGLDTGNAIESIGIDEQICVCDSTSIENRECLPERIETTYLTLSDLNNDEKQVYELCEKLKQVKCSDVEAVLGCKSNKAQGILNSLIQKGYMERKGKGKATRYLIVKFE